MIQIKIIITVIFRSRVKFLCSEACNTTKLLFCSHPRSRPGHNSSPAGYLSFCPKSYCEPWSYYGRKGDSAMRYHCNNLYKHNSNLCSSVRDSVENPRCSVRDGVGLPSLNRKAVEKIQVLQQDFDDN